MVAEGKEGTTSTVGTTRYGFTQQGCGARRPYSFAIVAPCGKTHYYSWQGLWSGTQGLGDPRPGDLHLRENTPPPPRAGRGETLGAEQRVDPIAVTSLSPVAGATHPCGCLWGQPGCPSSVRRAPGGGQDGGRLAGRCSLARWRLPWRQQRGQAAWGCVAAWSGGVRCCSAAAGAELFVCLPPACHGCRRLPATLRSAEPLWQELPRNFNAAD